MNPLCVMGCDIGPPQIRLVSLVHPMVAQSDLRSLEAGSTPLGCLPDGPQAWWAVVHWDL